MAKRYDFSTPPLTYSAEMDYPYPWNKPDPQKYYRQDEPLSPEQEALNQKRAVYRHQAQTILTHIQSLPRFLASRFTRIYYNKVRDNGADKAQYYLYFDFHKTLWPRLLATQNRYQIDFETHATCIPIYDIAPDIERYNHLPDLNSKAIKRLAKNMANGFYALFEQFNDELVAQFDGDRRVLFDLPYQSRIYGQIAELSLALHIVPSHYQTYEKYGRLKLKQIHSAIARLTSADFWVSRLKERRARWIESLSIAAMLVNCNATPYVSDRGVSAVLSQKLANLSYLKMMDVEDENTGERFDLYEKFEKSISNPANRYRELMAMTRGIENIADFRKDIGLFLTLTCPSKFHATSKSIKGKRHEDKKKNKYKASPNKKWVTTDENGIPCGALDVKAAQKYLTHVWSLIRTALGDKNIRFYGVRTVEPHHDSTPHWHILLFTSPRHEQAVIDTCRQKALVEDGDEQGAQEHRFTVEKMKKGRATGYIAKYIAKCVPGDHKGAKAMKNDIDIETGLPVHPVNGQGDIPAPDRIAAWASIWRIRQFQSFGIPSKGAYRECRRLKSLGKKSIAADLGAVAERVRAAADHGNFAEYILSQGGPCTPLPEQTLRVAREKVKEPNNYGEYRSKAVGLYTPLDTTRPVLNTYPRKYRIVKKNIDSTNHTKSGSMPLGGAIGAPWSAVNNCRFNISEVAESSANIPLKQPSETQNLPLEEECLGKKAVVIQKASVPIAAGSPKRQVSTLELTEKEQRLREAVRQFFDSKRFELTHDTLIDMFIKGMRVSDGLYTYWYDGDRLREKLNKQPEEPLKQETKTQNQTNADRIAAVLARVNTKEDNHDNQN
ncbi:replication endonuclease [Providencia manganoxydans]|uniref:replication endonuclease n=1 Tax=Providencia manganoxydans TaxID=2923283 RepID=UPI0029C07A6C|nr:replication endonuclease [Providencia manganoxydans]MDX4944349.1 replication endonuclease [Providencia manganoxydans]